MNVKSFNGYVLIVLSLVVIVAGAVLIALQWGNTADVSWYGQNRKVNTSLLMLCSLVGGVVLLWMFKLLFRGIRLVRQARPAAGPPAPQEHPPEQMP